MKAIEIKPDIYWVGAVDWSVRDFHGYVTPSGTTYNNYLIMDDEITLIDTVKYNFSHITARNIKSVTPLSKIRNIVINHIENDHASALQRIMASAPDATIYISGRGKQGLERFFNTAKWNVKVVKTGDEIKIGKRTLKFIETPMIHWPDSMMTYVVEEKLLITQDAFGQHLATTARFDDEFYKGGSISELEDATIDYYANILMPFGKLIKTKISQIQEMGLDIEMVAPDHGIIWRENPERPFQLYNEMADGKASLRIVIIYDTMWQSTEQMTLPIMQGIKDAGVDCKVIKLRATPMSVAIKEFWKARGCLVGSPTLNNEVYPSVAEFMIHLRGLRPKDRMIGAFGSYGWGGGAVKWILNKVKDMKVESVEPGVQVQYRPSAEDEDSCYEFGSDFARKVVEYHKQYQ